MISPRKKNWIFPLGHILVSVVLSLSMPFLAEARPKNSHPVITDLPEWSTVRRISVHPEGKYVLYEADQFTDEVYELFHHDMQSGKTKLLSPPLITSEQGLHQIGGIFLRDTFVIVVANYNDPLVYEWFKFDFVADTTYSFGNGTNITDLWGELSADGTRFCFKDDHYPTDGDELYCASHYKSTTYDFIVYAKISPAMSAGSGVSTFGISPQSDKVVYLADQNIGGIRELFSAGFLGEELTQINISAVSYYVPPIHVWVYIDDITEFVITPYTSRVIYTLTYSDNSNQTQFGTYVASLNGGSNARLVSTPGIPDPVYLGKYGQQIAFTENMEYFIYANTQNKSDGNIYSVSLVDGQAQVLGGQIVSGGSVSWIHVDGNSKVIFAADKQVKGVRNLYSVSVKGEGLHKLSNESVNFGYDLSKNNQSLLFTNQAMTQLFKLNISTEQLTFLGMIKGVVKAYGGIDEGENCYLIDDQADDIYAVCPSFNKSCNIISKPFPDSSYHVAAFDNSNNFIIWVWDWTIMRSRGPYSLNEEDLCSSNLLLLTLPAILGSSNK